MKAVTVIFNNQPINKTHAIQDGKLQTTSNAKTHKFMAATVPCETLKDFGEIDSELQSNNAMILGINKNGLAKYNCDVKERANYQDVFARTKAEYVFSHIQLLDVDVSEDTPDHLVFNTYQENIEALSNVFPSFKDAALYIKNSSSANLYHDGKELTKNLPKRHIFFSVKDPLDIPRFAKVLEARCWLKGYGYHIENKNGHKLCRTIFDTAVFSRERLVFEAPPTLLDGIEQRQNKPVLVDGQVIDTSLLPDLTEEEELKYAELTGRGMYKTVVRDGVKIKEYVKNSVYTTRFFDLEDSTEVRDETGKVFTVAEFMSPYKNGAKYENKMVRVHSSFRFGSFEDFDHPRAPSAMLNIDEKGRYWLYDHSDGSVHFPPHLAHHFTDNDQPTKPNKACRRIMSKIVTQETKLNKALLQLMKLKSVKIESDNLIDLSARIKAASEAKDFKEAVKLQDRFDKLEKTLARQYDESQENIPEKEKYILELTLTIDGLKKQLEAEEAVIEETVEKKVEKSERAEKIAKQWNYVTTEEFFYKKNNDGSWLRLKEKGFRVRENLSPAIAFQHVLDLMRANGNIYDDTIYTFDVPPPRTLNLMSIDHWGADTSEETDSTPHEFFSILEDSLSSQRPDVKFFLRHCLHHKILFPEDQNLPSINFYGVGGGGKNLWTDVILPTFFKTGCLTVDQKDVLGNFNASLYGKLITHVEELQHEKHLTSRMKQMIGNRTVNITRKGQDTFTTPATAWIITSRNGNKIGINLEGNGVDRRYSPIRLTKTLVEVVSEAKNMDTSEAKEYIEEMANTVCRNGIEVSKYIEDILEDESIPDTCPKAFHGEDYIEGLNANATIFEDICVGTFHNEFDYIPVTDMYEAYKQNIQENADEAYPMSFMKFTTEVSRWIQQRKKNITKITDETMVNKIIVKKLFFVKDGEELPSIEKSIKKNTKLKGLMNND